MAEPSVTGLGPAMEAAITVPARIQEAANLKGGGIQQSITVKVIFFVKNKGFDEFVMLTPFSINFNARPAETCN